MRPLAESLNWPELADTAVTSAGLEALGPCPELSSLDLSGTSVDDEDLAAFPRRYPKLLTIYLARTAVTDDGRTALRAASPRLSIY